MCEHISKGSSLMEKLKLQLLRECSTATLTQTQHNPRLIRDTSRNKIAAAQQPHSSCSLHASCNDVGAEAVEGPHYTNTDTAAANHASAILQD